ncbi:MAG: hypothetical protein K8R92_01465 [Planctomycetes bacterium]|nr:hypothetical protein [Planctomycetota bacterium]
MHLRASTAMVVLLGAGSAVADSSLNITDVGSLTANSNAQVVSADGSVVGGHSADQTFRWTGEDGMHGLGTLPGAEHPFDATAMSADGNSVIGTSDTFDAASGMSIRKIVLWTSGGGLFNLGEPPSASQGHNEWDMNASPQISGNGLVVVAMRQGSDGHRIWRWSSESGWQDLNPPPGGTTQWDSSVLRLSFDGSFLIANSQDDKAWRWSDDDGWTAVEANWTLDEGGGAWATDISADGSVVVGITAFDMGGHVFRWTAEFGMDDLGQPLGGLPGDKLFISGDGLVIAGSCEGYFGNEHFVTRAFRWEAGGGDALDGGWQALGTLSEDESSKASGLNFNGSVVVGQSFTEDPDTQITLVNHAFRWSTWDGIADLGTLPNDATDSGANAVNNDGTVVVGVMARRVQPTQMVEVRAFRWTNDDGVESLGALASPTFPGDVSSDGSTVVGQAIFGDLLHENQQQGSESGSHAFRWTDFTGIEDLGMAPGEFDARAEFANGDGSVVVGTTRSRDESTGRRSTQAFRWSGEGLDHLGTLSGDTDSYIASETHPGPDDESGGGRCVSEDGSVVVGTSENRDPQTGELIGSRAFLWWDGEGMYNLGALDEGQNSYAQAVSGDGSTVVGGSAGPDENEHFIHRAFRWTDEDGMQNLGTLPGTENAVAFFTSVDGSVVVGSCFNTDPNSGDRKEFQAFRWTDGDGMVSLGTLPEDSGQDSYWPVSVSSDGSVVLGMRHHPGVGGGTRTAFLWSVDHGMVALPSALQHIHAFSLSGDGSLVAGATNAGSGRAACIWNASFGLVDLRAYLVAFGLNMDSWNLLECGISKDGSTIVGTHEIDERTSTFVVTGFHTLPTNVEAWGYDDFGQTNLPVTLGNCKAVSAGIYYSMALQDDGTVVAWGRNDFGQCNVPFDLGPCKAIAAGSYHGVALKLDGTVVCWGSNGLGQCDVPADLGPCKAIAGGRYHTVALREDGTVVAWGAGTFSDSSFYHHGQSVVPGDLGTCKAIAAGGFHSMAIKEDGTVVAWGSGYQGAGHSTVPPDLGLCKQIGAGFDHSLALLEDGTVVAWGANNVGQGSVPAGLGACSRIAAGTQHSLAIKLDGTAAAWGQNDFGEGSVAADLGPCMAIAGGGYHTLIIHVPMEIPPPTDVAASDGTSTDEVSVTWTGVAGADSYSILRAGDGPAAEIGTSLTTNYSDTSAVPGTLYTYTVKAIKGALVSVESAGDTGYRNLSAPSDVAASDGTSTTEVAVTWSGSTGAASYEIFRSTGGSPTHIGDSGTTTYHDNSAVAGTLYTYSVKAVGNVGTSAASGADTGWRHVLAPTNVLASAGSSTSEVALTWTASTGATGYQIFRDGGESPIGTSGSASYHDTSAPIGITASYAIRAVYTISEMDHYSDLSTPGATGWRAPAAPSFVEASDGASTAMVSVAWNEVTGATGYEVSRNGVVIRAPEVQTTASFDDVVTAGLSFTYVIRAHAPAGYGPASAPETGFQNISPPTGVAATDGNFTDHVEITWNAAADAVGYQIFRSGTSGPIGATTSALTFSDTTGGIGTTYSYWVKSVSQAGAGSNPVIPSSSSLVNSGYRKVAAPTGVVASDGLGSKVTVTWTTVPGAVGYYIYRTSGVTTALAGTVTGNAVGTYDDVTATFGTLFTYTVKALAPAGLSDPSAGNTGYRMAAPTGVLASDGSLTNMVFVNWTAPANATGYQILRRLNPADEPTTIATIVSGAVLSGGDLTADPNTIYLYSVRANSAAGYGPESPTDSGYRGMPAPTAVAASDGEYEDSIRVQWSPIAGVSGYEILRNGVSIGTVAGGSSTPFYVDGNTGAVAPVTTYTYTVKSLYGESGSSLASLGNTGWRGPAPKNVAASDGQYSNHVDIIWTKMIGVSTYRVFRNGVQISGKLTGSGNIMLMSDTTAMPNVTYTYTVRAVLALGLGPASLGDSGSLMGNISSLTGGDTGDSSGDAGKHGKGSRSSHGSGGAAAGGETKDVTQDAETVEAVELVDESSVVCDELFLRISDRIAAAQNELDTAISTNDGAGSTAGAAIGVKTFDRAETTRMIADLVEQLTLDADQNGVLDLCQRAGGDVDINGTVDDFDMVAFVTAMESGDLRVGDLNGDGEIDGADLGMLLLAFPEIDHGDAVDALDSKVSGAE